MKLNFGYPHTELFGAQGKSVAVLCLEGFSQMLQTITARFNFRKDPKMSLEVFLSAVNPAAIDESTGFNESLHFFIKHFQVAISHHHWGIYLCIFLHTHKL